jgi:hypothetical protein
VAPLSSTPKLSPAGVAALFAVAGRVLQQEAVEKQERIRPSNDRFREKPDEVQVGRRRAERLLAKEDTLAPSVESSAQRTTSNSEAQTLKSEIFGQMVARNLQRQGRLR